MTKQNKSDKLIGYFCLNIYYNNRLAINMLIKQTVHIILLRCLIKKIKKSTIIFNDIK